MSVPILEALADAIYAFEGNKATNRAYQNRNPGNLRASHWPHTMDPQGYCVFRTFTNGYAALLEDLRAKVSGHNAHGLNLNSTILDLLQVYSPAGDNNRPEQYASFVANWLRNAYNGVAILPSTTFLALYELEGQEPPDGVAGA